MGYSKELLLRMKISSALLEPPAGEVVCELIDELTRLQSVEKAQEWIPVSKIHNTHSGNRVIIHMANDFVVIATFFMQNGLNGFFRNDNGSIVAYDDVIEYINIPKFATPTGETK